MLTINVSSPLLSTLFFLDASWFCSAFIFHFIDFNIFEAFRIIVNEMPLPKW